LPRVAARNGGTRYPQLPPSPAGLSVGPQPLSGSRACGRRSSKRRHWCENPCPRPWPHGITRLVAAAPPVSIDTLLRPRHDRAIATSPERAAAALQLVAGTRFGDLIARLRIPTIPIGGTSSS